MRNMREVIELCLDELDDESEITEFIGVQRVAV